MFDAKEEDQRNAQVVVHHSLAHTKSVALPVPSFTLAQVLDENYKDEITCSCCKGAIQTPVEILPCKSLYCCNCALSLATSSSFTCPCCSCMHQSIDSTFTKPSSIVEKMINSLSVKCDVAGENRPTGASLIIEQ